MQVNFRPIYASYASYSFILHGESTHKTWIATIKPLDLLCVPRCTIFLTDLLIVCCCRLASLCVLVDLEVSTVLIDKKSVSLNNNIIINVPNIKLIRQSTQRDCFILTLTQGYKTAHSVGYVRAGRSSCTRWSDIPID